MEPHKDKYISNLDSMYADYKLEYENIHTVFEPGLGFANFSIEKNTPEGLEIYIQEIYVKPHKRQKKIASELADYCIAEAVLLYDKPVKKIYGSIDLDSNTKDISIKALLGYGFKILSANEKIIYFHKELTNG